MTYIMFEQTMIVMSMLPTFLLVGSLRFKTRRWAYLTALVGQPFWITMAIRTGTWGTLVVACWCTLSWARGAWLHWATPRLLARLEKSLRE